MAARSPGSPISPGDLVASNSRTSTIGFVDPNGNDWIVMNDTVGAVNALQVQNNVSGSPVVLTVGGQSPDTNASMSILQKGTGTLTIGGASGTVSIVGATVSFPGSLSVTNLTATGWVNTSGLTVNANATVAGFLSTAALTVSGTTTTFTGTAARILMHTADATQAAKVIFTEAGANSNMSLLIMPSGTGTFSQFMAFNSSTPDNAGRFQLQVNGTSVLLTAGATGSGTAVGLELDLGSTSNPVFQAPVGGNVTINSATNNVKIGINGTTGNVGSILFFDSTLAALATNFSVPTIPSGFKNIRWLFQGRSTVAATSANLSVTLNGDTGGNYDSISIYGEQITALVTETNAGSSFLTGPALGGVPGASVTRSAIAGLIEGSVYNYAGTTWEKQMTARGGYADSTAANSMSLSAAGSWRNTAAVTGLSVTLGGTNSFATNSRLTVYLDN